MVTPRTPTDARTAYPQAQARQMLQQYWNQSFPVDPVRIAVAAGVAVYGLGKENPFPYSGRFRLVDGKPVIEYNVTEGNIRQRFTVAHALGHFACKHENPPPEEGPFYSNTGHMEKAATAFARELIIPESIVRAYYTEGRFSSVEQMATFFGVSVDAMAYRLIDLRLV